MSDTLRRSEESTEAAREALLDAAERLFAERGIHAVSDAQIGAAAGQAGVIPDVGSKDELVRAILDKHSDAIAMVRVRLIEQLQDPDDLRSWVSVAVRSVTDHLESLRQPTWYARFVAQVAADPTLHHLDAEDPSSAGSYADSPSARRLMDGLNRTLPALPPAVTEARSAVTRHLVTQTLVDRERLLAEANGPRVALTWSQCAEGLTDAIVAIWTTPTPTDELETVGVAASTDCPPGPSSEMLTFARRMREDFSRFMIEYRFAVDEVLTKVTILREEFLHLHRYNPIEHITSRLKTPESILEKVVRRNCEPTLPAIRETITDIAGVRITCSFIADTYRLLEALTSQDDIRVLEIKDYIAKPKPNGYKSLHAIIEIPVFLSTGAVPVIVEVQIRTIAMDFWASLEHKIFYKYDGAVPGHLAADLADAARAAEDLDRRMEQLHTEVHGSPTMRDMRDDLASIDDALLRQLWELSQRSDFGE